MENKISVYKKADGNWVAEVKIGKYDNGRVKIKRFYADKKRIVTMRAEDFLKEKEKESEIKDTTNNIESILLENVINQYLFTYKIHLVKPQTFDKIYINSKLIIKYLGNIPLSEVTQNMLQNNLLFKMKTDGYSYDSVKKTKGLVNALFSYAYDNRMIEENNIKNLIVPAKKLFDKGEIKFFDDDEIEIFKNEALKDKYSNGCLLIALIYTGLRGGELCALKKGDIDFTNKCIYVNKIVQRVCSYDDNAQRVDSTQVIQKSTKTSDGRIVKLSKSAIDYLNLHFSRHPEIVDDDYVVYSKISDIPAPNSLRRQMSCVLDNTEIVGKRGLHTLRHTCASLMIRRGIDIRVVSEVLGHTDTAFTYRTYVHVVDKQKQEAMEALDF